MWQTWAVPAAILIAFAVMLLLPLLETVLKSVRPVRFHCALAGKDVTLELEEHSSFAVPGPAEVRSCSAFDEPRAVTCDKPCLRAKPWIS